MKVVELSADKGATCAAILRALPQWFGIEASVVQYIADVEAMPMFVARDGDRAVGFLALAQRTDATHEIHVMGVLPEYHRRGVGRLLVAAAIVHARQRGASLLSVKTLDASRESPEYARTRRFYLSQGFLPVEVFPTLWGAANPCLLLVLPLARRD